MEKIEFSRCLLCLSEGPKTGEHLMPAALGARFQTWCLCKSCNDWAGHELVPTLVNDPAVVYAIENLKNQVPWLYERRTQRYAGTAEDGTRVRLTRKKGKVKVEPGPGANGSKIWDTNEFRKQQVARQGPEILEAFDALPEGRPLDLPDGRTVIKHPGPKVMPETSVPARLKLSTLRTHNSPTPHLVMVV